MLFSEASDVSVRPAVSGDEVTITQIQVTAWQTAHQHLLGTEVLEALDLDRMTQQWAQAVISPPSPEFAVLVACAGATVVGFAAVAPQHLVALEVDPEHHRHGHGSRLLSASVDHLQRIGSTNISTWILEGDAAREAFFTGAGLRADGRVRTLATGPREVRESRWGALLT